MAINFSTLSPWKNMRRCNLADDGTVNAYYGDAEYKDDGSNGQVMVEIPKFWYKKVLNGDTYTFAVSDQAENGFTVHPAFYRDRNGDGIAEEVNYRYFSAYEGILNNGLMPIPHSATNLAINGNFADGTSGWNSDYSTISASNNTLTCTANGDAESPYIYQIYAEVVVGNIYYRSVKARVTNDVCARLRANSVDFNNPIQNQWYKSSRVFTATKTSELMICRAYYADAATANGKVLEVQEFIAIDLTTLYGAGNEPTKEQCDLLFNNWFDGTGTFFSATNLVINGNFANGTSGWGGSGGAPILGADGATFSPGTQWGSLANLNILDASNGDVVYARVLMKATSNLAKLCIYRNDLSTIGTDPHHSGSGNFELISTVLTMSDLSPGYPLIGVYDSSTSEWPPITVKEFMTINLTAMYGAGNEPTKEQCDLLFSSWFDGTTNTINPYINGDIFAVDQSVNVGTNPTWKLTSVSGYVPLVFMNLGAFRTLAGRRGNGWGILDFNLVYAVQMLYFVEYASFDSQTKIGLGNDNNYGILIATGSTASLGNNTGNMGNDGSHAISYRGIENLYGNAPKMVDGVTTTDGILVGNANFNNVGTGYTSYAHTMNLGTGYATDIFPESELGFIASSLSGTMTSKLCDYGGGNLYSYPIYGGGSDNGYQSGAFFLVFNYSQSDNTSTTISRLAF